MHTSLLPEEFIGGNSKNNYLENEKKNREKCIENKMVVSIRFDSLIELLQV